MGAWRNTKGHRGGMEECGRDTEGCKEALQDAKEDTVGHRGWCGAH